ncbi:MAG TPA: DUF58 domain-containing protein [Anaerolineaceae bacterium]|nr:DUF58 domain-containing protein [Anaerolineaceae bacterium]
MKPTGRTTLLAFLTLALILAGLGFLRGGPILALLPLLVYWGAALLAVPRKVRLKAVRELEQRQVKPGTSVRVRLIVKNEGAPVEELRVQDTLPEGLVLTEGTPGLTATLGRGETLELEYRVEGKRGSYLFKSTQVQASDAFGLLRREATLDAPAELVVLPDLVRLRRAVWVRPLKTHGFAGPIPARLGGSGIDFFGLRDYQMGDPRRWINWRVSARYDQGLFTNQFEQERIANIGLILDSREQIYISNEQVSLFEYAVQAAASLADAFLSAGNRVSLFVYGYTLQRTFPGYGKVQLERIRHILAQARAGHNFALEQLDQLPTRFFPAQTQLVLISPLREEDTPVLLRLRARGYQLLVVSPDPVEFEHSLAASQPNLELGYRYARAERRLLLNELGRMGIQTVNWNVARPFDQAMEHFSHRVFSGAYWAGIEG